MEKTEVPDSVIERFKKRVHPREDGCWMWLGPVDKDGYGKLAFRKGPGVRYYIRTHRFQVLLRDGHLDDTAVVMHSCDNPNCVNPAHLSVGTHIENEHDKLRKQRNKFGEKHPAAVFTDAQVEEVINGLLAGKRLTDYMKKFKVSRRAVQHITEPSGNCWKHVWAKFPSGTKELVGSKIKNHGEYCTWTKLTEDDVRKIRVLAAKGIAQHRIGAQFGIGQMQVSRIVRRERWAHVA